MVSDPSDPGRSSRPAPFPERLGRYEVLLPIASGGMATVYLARSVGMAGFERDVALKLTHDHLRDDPEFVASLMDEARLAGRIRHPNVVSVLDVAEDPYGVFIVMEYVEGESLAKTMRLLRKAGQQMPMGVALRIMDDVLAGLHAAHELRDEQGEPLSVIHRDVTPHNILLGIDGVAKLTDFGIAKAASRLAHTKTGLVKGKIAYMSPEQAQAHDIDRRVDVWAAGVLAWEMLAGTRLFDGPNDAAVLLKIVRETPPRVRSLRRDVPREVDDAIAAALQPEVDDRHPTALAFARALAAAGKSAGVARAERPEVTQFLVPLLTDRLESRKQKVREVRALRQRVGELAGLSASFRQSHSSISDLESPEIQIVPLLPALSAGPAADVEPTAALPPERVAAAAAVPAVAPDPQTGSAGISSLARTLVPPRRRSLWAGAAAGGLVLALLGVVALMASSEEEVRVPGSSVPSASGQPPLVEIEPLGTVAPSATSEIATPAGSPSDAGVDAAAPAKRRPAGGVPRKFAPAPRSTPRSTAPPPLSNPYLHK